MRIATITPHRNRVKLIRNHLYSLSYQTRQPDQIIVSSQGDSKEDLNKLHEFVESDACLRTSQCDEIILTYNPKDSPEDPWCKPLAVNRGIRASDADILVVLDADMILHPKMLEALEKEFERNPRIFLHCMNRSFAHNVTCDLDFDGGWDYDMMHPSTQWVRPIKRGKLGPWSKGIGGCQAAHRDWWYDVRGMDEDFKWWGMEDFDLHKRAKKSRLPIVWLPRELSMLHQWHHPGQHDRGMGKYLKKNARICWRKLAQGTVIRNPESWGDE